jgi:sugar phosphate isomerase/epimerase
MEHSSAERGKVTGTPVGCGCGDGVVDFPRILEILAGQDRELFLSVECGTVDQAARSIEYLTPLIEAANAQG